MSVGRLLEEGHYTRQKLNEEVSKKFLLTYLELLDFSHLFFTQQDIDALTAKYGNSMAGDVLLGTLKPAYDVYGLYTKRVDERVAPVESAAFHRDPLPPGRSRRQGGMPQDRALYGCSCGYAFNAQVSTSVGCPHCGRTQAW